MTPSDKEFYRKQITETIPEYFFVFDVAEKKIVYLSDTFRKLNVYQDSDNISNMRELIHRDYQDVFDRIFHQLENGNYTQNEELKINDAETAVQWVNISTHPIQSRGSQKVACHVLDITNKSFEIAGLQKENCELEDILHIMVHDLRSPLGSIMNLLEIQQSAFDEENYGDTRAYNAVAQRIARDMNTMISSMVEMVQLRSNRFQLKASKTNLTALIRGISENYANDISNKGIKYKEELPDNDISLVIDPVKFRLVIQNLLSNAIKFTNKNGQITVAVKESDNEVTLKVSDDGIGVSKDQQEEIFEKFTKVRKLGTKGEKSVGLGLSITKKIVELHHGSVRVQSDICKGATFIVKIPKLS